MAFSPQKGRLLASGGADNLVFVWKSNIPEDVYGDEESRSTVEATGEKIGVTRRQVERMNNVKEKVLNRLGKASDDNKENQSEKKQTTDTHSSSASESERLLRKENDMLRNELTETKEKVDALTEAIVLLERRITLIEDQMRLEAETPGTEQQ